MRWCRSLLVVVVLLNGSACKLLRSKCDAQALAATAATFGEIPDENAAKALAGFVSGCAATFSKDERDSLNSFIANSTDESARNAVLVGPLGRASCPRIFSVLEHSQNIVWRYRHSMTFEECHFERLDYVTAERFKESFGPYGFGGSVLGAISFGWMVEHGTEKALARQISVALSGTPPVAVIGVRELAEAEAAVAISMANPALGVSPAGVELDGKPLATFPPNQLADPEKTQELLVASREALERARAVHGSRAFNLFVDRSVPAAVVLGVARALRAIGDDALRLAVFDGEQLKVLPIDVETKEQGPNELGLTVFAADDGFRISGSGGELPAIPLVNGTYDYKALNSMMQATKSAFPGEVRLSVGAANAVPMEVLAKSLAAAVTGHGEPMFSTVLLTSRATSAPTPAADAQ